MNSTSYVSFTLGRHLLNRKRYYSIKLWTRKCCVLSCFSIFIVIVCLRVWLFTEDSFHIEAYLFRKTGRLSETHNRTSNSPPHIFSNHRGLMVHSSWTVNKFIESFHSLYIFNVSFILYSFRRLDRTWVHDVRRFPGLILQTTKPSTLVSVLITTNQTPQTDYVNREVRGVQTQVGITGVSRCLLLRSCKNKTNTFIPFLIVSRVYLHFKSSC